jgi:Dolichyl-phosphate-mannose-protein mannosyltransferase
VTGAVARTRRPLRVSGAALAVGGITLGALALRLAAFDESFFADELFTHEISTRPDLHAVLAGVRSDLEISPPLFFAVAWLFQELGDPFVWLRLPSLLAGVATVPAVYVLGLLTVGRRAALVGTGLFALSPLAIFYATEARAYALMTLLVVLSTIALLKAIETNDRRWWAALAVLDAGAMYAHYTAAFVLAAQAGWALWTQRELRRPLLLAHGAAALLYAPWLPFLIEDSEAPAQKVIGVLEPFGAATVVRNVGRLVAGGPFVPLTDLPGTPAFVLLGAAAAIGLGGLVWRAHRAGRRALPQRVALIAALALAAPVGAGLYSALGDDLFLVRNLISSLPALALAFAALLTALPRAPALAALALAFGALGLGAAGTFEQDSKRPAFEDVAAYLEARARPGDVVLDLNVFMEPPGLALQVQVDPDLPFFKMGFPYHEERQALEAAEAGGGRVLYVRPEVSVFRGVVPERVARRFRAGETRTWPGLQPLTVVVYEQR